MENKYLKYGLFVLVALVWGAIVYRVVGGTREPEGGPVTVADPPKADPPEHSDSFPLFADYPDPFIPEADSVVVSGAGHGGGDPRGATGGAGVGGPGVGQPVPGSLPGGPGNGGMPAAEPFTEKAVRGYLLYTGMISNPQKKQTVAILSLRGRELLLREKEKAEDLTVKKIEKDKVTVVYRGRVFTIYKSN